VIEVDRTNRQDRRMQGKSDPVDAIEAARAALSGRARGIAKTADGNVEAIRALLVAQRSRQARARCLNQIRHLGITSPDALREQFRDVPKAHLADRAAGLRPRAGGDPVLHATKLAMRTLGRRALAISDDMHALDVVLGELVTATAPALLACHGVGVIPLRSCWSRPATTPNGSVTKPRGRTCAVSLPPKPTRANNAADIG
jgi:hypothetical protein